MPHPLTKFDLRSVSTPLVETGPLSTAASDFHHRIHSANKVARTHERVSLTDEKETSMCDICQVPPLACTSTVTGKAVCREEFASFLCDPFLCC